MAIHRPEQTVFWQKLAAGHFWPCFCRPKSGEGDKMRSVSKNMRCNKKAYLPQFSRCWSWWSWEECHFSILPLSHSRQVPISRLSTLMNFSTHCWCCKWEKCTIWGTCIFLPWNFGDSGTYKAETHPQFVEDTWPTEFSDLTCLLRKAIMAKPSQVEKGKKIIWLSDTQRQTKFFFEIFADHMFEIALMFVVWFWYLLFKMQRVQLIW